MYRRDSFVLLLALALTASAQYVAERRAPAPAPAATPALVVDDGAWPEGVKLALIIDHPDPDLDMPMDHFHDRMWR